MNNNFYLNAGCACITPALIALLMMRTGLRWEMHPAQVCGLQMQTLKLEATVENVTALDPQKFAELMPHTMGVTLMGLPVHIKEEYSMSLVRLMYKDEEVSRIEALAIPCGFMKGSDEDLEVERKKMETIGYHL
jgi:hypothetical protein